MIGGNIEYRVRDDVVETLLSLPAHNLESRILDIERQLSLRSAISCRILSELETASVRLTDRLWRLRYSEASGPGSPRAQVESERRRAQERIHIELGSCFRDQQVLREKLQTAREKLILENQKLRLLQDES